MVYTLFGIPKAILLYKHWGLYTKTEIESRAQQRNIQCTSYTIKTLFPETCILGRDK